MLEAYSKRDIQTARQLLIRCRDEGLDLASTLVLLEELTAGGATPAAALQKRAVNGDSCPDCGVIMRPTQTVEKKRKKHMTELERQNAGLTIVTCPVCRYSEMRL